VGGTKNDIALIKMPQPIQYGYTVQPACLPASNFATTYKQVWLSGWGATDVDGLLF
jgi:hypothetical protein